MNHPSSTEPKSLAKRSRSCTLSKPLRLKLASTQPPEPPAKALPFAALALPG